IEVVKVASGSAGNHDALGFTLVVHLVQSPGNVGIRHMRVRSEPWYVGRAASFIIPLSLPGEKIGKEILQSSYSCLVGQRTVDFTTTFR
ncbi:MAG: hypothetical protein ACK2UN_21365, partial [Candidatus Promineifilaceae bacterium]